MFDFFKKIKIVFTEKNQAVCNKICYYYINLFYYTKIYLVFFFMDFTYLRPF